MPDPFPNERPTFCVTMDCGLRATRYVTCDGEGRHPYCEECAEGGRLMPNQSTPEIDRLRMLPTAANPHVVPLPAAIQAVRDTEDRTVREIVEALRENPSAVIALESLHPLTADLALHEAADWLSRRFLSPDNPEGNA